MALESRTTHEKLINFIHGKTVDWVYCAACVVIEFGGTPLLPKTCYQKIGISTYLTTHPILSYRKTPYFSFPPRSRIYRRLIPPRRYKVEPTSRYSIFPTQLKLLTVGRRWTHKNFVAVVTPRDFTTCSWCASAEVRVAALVERFSMTKVISLERTRKFHKHRVLLLKVRLPILEARQLILNSPAFFLR